MYTHCMLLGGPHGRGKGVAVGGEPGQQVVVETLLMKTGM